MMMMNDDECAHLCGLRQFSPIIITLNRIELLLYISIGICHNVSNLTVLFQSKTWGFDFHRNGKIEKSASGQYSTEIFTKQSEDIIANHDISKV